MTNDTTGATGQLPVVDLRPVDLPLVDLPVVDLRSRVENGASSHHEMRAADGGLTARARVALLLDADSFVEDRPVDGVVAGRGLVHGRPVCVLATDPTAGGEAAGVPTAEQVLRVLETAYRTRVPMVWLIDVAGPQLHDHLERFLGRRGAGQFARTQALASGSIPQFGGLFGRSAAGGADLPVACDVQVPVPTDRDGLAALRRCLAYFPDSVEQDPPAAEPVAAEVVDLRALVPAGAQQAVDLRRYLTGLLDGGSLLELRALGPPGWTFGYGRLGGRVVGVLTDTALPTDQPDLTARFLQTCEAFNLPLLYLTGGPDLAGPVVRRVGPVTVPTIWVVLRGAEGAGLPALTGPGWAPDVCLALPTAGLAVTGPGAAVNARYASRIAALSAEERELFLDDGEDDLAGLAGQPVVDAVVEPEDLRAELIRRYAGLRDKDRSFSRSQHVV